MTHPVPPGSVEVLVVKVVREVVEELRVDSLGRRVHRVHEAERGGVIDLHRVDIRGVRDALRRNRAGRRGRSGGARRAEAGAGALHIR
eukprot:CAMPEP_0185308486 /NCGR_PEP_ID=MMETSP1363-20130426/20034_1 /TAXON_ID=38817 /ORGANISM="Gephyrocapsa oceanica, Strain RCC1303" /LENGTH=87 /DNA_ID=CAMNT_0027905911 /DNA_START=266 /DNA_END=529 /DNA_ORIENTATION=-